MTDTTPGLPPPTQPVSTVPLLGGRYRVGPLLGRGGSADVYRCTDTILGREVAVKILREAGEDALARHRGEIATLARLSHPGLVTLHDAGTDGDRAWFVMECVEGQTLADRLRGGALSLPEAARVGQSLAAALAHVHASGVVHRDIKPGNVLLGDDGLVKLTDFGIALVAGEARVTRTGLAVGTAAYIAPEQVEGAGTDDRVDVYSLGLVLLEAVTGRRAYEGSTVESALARLHRQPDVPSHLPDVWRTLLTAMTSRDADDRPMMADVEHQMTVLATGAPVGAATTVLTTRPPAPAADPTRTLPTPGPAAEDPSPGTSQLATSRPPTPRRERTELAGLPMPVVYVLAGILALVLVSGLALLASGSDDPTPTAPTGTVAPSDPVGDPDDVGPGLDRLTELVQP